MRSKYINLLLLIMFPVLLVGCGGGAGTAAPEGEYSSPAYESPGIADGDAARGQQSDGGEEDTMKITIEAGGSVFTATLENNGAADALAQRLSEGPLTVELRDYGGFEKVGSLGFSLPASNRQITTQAGDIVLYQGDQIVMFYGSNSWSYTKLASVDDLTGWAEALGSGDLAVTFSIK